MEGFLHGGILTKGFCCEGILSWIREDRLVEARARSLGRLEELYRGGLQGIVIAPTLCP